MGDPVLEAVTEALGTIKDNAIDVIPVALGLAIVVFGGRYVWKTAKKFVH